MLKHTAGYEWLRLDGDVAIVGITRAAQQGLGDFVFVQLPSVGAKFQQGAAVAIVESAKAAAEICAPVDGEIIEVNRSAMAEPGLLNSDPTGDGWLFKLKIASKAQVDALPDEAAWNEGL